MANGNILSMGAMPHSRSVLSSRVRIFALGTRDGNTNNRGAGPAGSRNPQLVGNISSFGVSSSRNLEAVRGIGLGDHIIEMVPGQSEPLSLSVTRAALAVANMFQAFGYAGGIDGAVRALKHHRYPVDIKQDVLISELADPQNSYAGIPSGIVTEPEPAPDAAKPDPDRGGYRVADGLTDYENGGFRAIITWYLGCWFEDFNVTYGVDNAVISEEGTLKVTDVSGFEDKTLIIPYAISANASEIWFPDTVN